MSNVRPWVKIALIMLIVAGLGIVLFNLSKKSDVANTSSSNSSSITDVFSGNDELITIGVNTYAGFTPIIWLNSGLEPNENSVIFKEYGLKLKIIIQDDFVAGRSAFKNNDINIIYCTTDVLATEMGATSDMIDAKQFMILNKSRGADALVVNKNIKTVADLKGKKIAVAEGTASHTLLINTLETNGINTTDIQIIKVGNGMEAAQAFKAGQVDACVTWSPDDADCVEAVKGSKVLVSTKQASELITDGLIAKASYIEKNRVNITKLISAILYANSIMNTDDSKVREAAIYFAKAFGTDEVFCISGCKNIRFATLGDQANFLGITTNYTGTTADGIYSKMARTYEEIGLTKSPLSWRKVSDISMIEDLYTSKNVKGDQSPEQTVKFIAPVKTDVSKPEISNKKLTIQFTTNSDLLDDNARSVIDREFVNIAKQFASTRIRVEGNTDWVGDSKYNEDLSLRRANSVVSYLIKEYNFDQNRFIIVGNGFKHAKEDKIKGDNEKYRVTDFELIAD